MVTREEIDNFTQFAVGQINNGGADLSMDEFYDLWRAHHPAPEELSERVVAVKAALADLENGDTGIPAEEHLAKLKVKYNIADDA